MQSITKQIQYKMKPARDNEKVLLPFFPFNFCKIVAATLFRLSQLSHHLCSCALFCDVNSQDPRT